MASSISGRAPFMISSCGVSAETFYTVFGDIQSSEQVPLVVGHGARITHHYLKSLSHLTEEHSIPVILYDRIGFGQSTHFPDQAGNSSFWTVDVLVEQLLELVRYLGVEKRYDFLGHSFGTVLGMEVASRRELRMGLRKLILCNPAASTSLLGKSMRKRRDMVPKEIQETLIRHEKDGTTDSEDYKRAMLAFRHDSFCRLKVWPEDVLESLSYSSKDLDAALILFGDSPWEVKGTTKDWSALEIAHDITVPTLLMNGRYDWSDEAVEPLFRAIPVVKWVAFSNSSHLLHIEEKERFMDVVSKWLSVDLAL
ncbi:proline iminopeptidase [Mycena floridula]|nr:proline iminopeptidase [Mycena floridula]